MRVDLVRAKRGRNKTKTKTVNARYEWAMRRFGPLKPLLGDSFKTERFMFKKLLGWLVRLLVQCLMKWLLDKILFNWP